MRKTISLMGISRRLGLAILSVMACVSFCVTSSFGAPYGPEGKAVDYRQPDGTTVKVRVLGDEFYAVTETEEGYTVVYDKQNVLRYGRLLPNGKKIVPTGIRADNNPDHNKLQKLGIEKHVRLTPEGIKEAVNRGLQRMRADRKGRITPESVEYYKRAIKEAKEKIASDPTLAASYAGGDVGDPLVPPPPSFAPPSATKIGGFVGLCILVDFSDQAGTIPQSSVDDYCNKPGYNGDLNKGSIYDYFYSQSNGKLRYNNIVTAYVRVPNPKTFYDDGVDGVWGDSRAQDLVSDALDVLMAQGFDFTQLSRDGAGVIDAINLFYAGTCASDWSTGLWPHRWAIPTKTVDAANGIKAYDYQMTDMKTELSIGTFCHENGHMLLGYADYYDYKTDGIASLGMSSTTLMASYGSSKNPHNIHAYLKMHSGWLNMTDLRGTSTPRRYALRVDSDLGYMFSNPSLSTEYFIFENRAKVGWEANGTLADQGMMITHNDEGGTRDAQNMTEALHYECSVEQADNLFEYEKNTGATDSSDFFHLGGTGPNTSFDDTTSPNAKWWAGASSGNGDDGTASGLVIHSIGSAGEFISFVYGTGTPSATRIIGLTETVFNPRCDFGQNADPRAFGVYNQNGGTLDYTISDDAAWLSVNITAGTASTEVDKITISFSTSGLSVGSYTATITVTDSGASPTTATITVNLTVNPQPTISFTVPSITGNGDEGLAGPQESFGLLNIGGGEMTYTVSSTQSWLSLSPTSGTVLAETDTIYADFDATSLASGTYYDTITITSPEAPNSPQTLPVTFNVQSTDMILTSPNGGETWQWSDTKAITWASSLGGTVKIELLKTGLLDTTITGSTANDGSFDWMVPYGQTAGSDYTVKITSVDNTNKWDASNAGFSILNPPLYFTDFEGSASLPTGMTDVLVSGSATPTWKIQTGGYTGGQHPSAAHSGTNNATLYSSADSTRRLITPVFSTLNHTNLTLQFWHTQEVWPADQDTLTVYYSTNGGSGWTQLVKYTNSIAAWTEETITLPVASTNTKIAFEGYATYGYGVCVDDVSVRGTYSPAGPEIAVTRSGAVEDGGTSTVSGTEVGVGTQLVYTISNLGGADVMLTTPVAATPVSNCSISVNTQPGTPIVPSGSTQLVLTVTPTNLGPWSASVSIVNNDSDENPYNWTISGTAVIKYALTVNNGTGDGSYADGEAANIVADAPATGYHFVNWTASGGGSFGNVNAASTTYTMPANNATVTANYALDTYIVAYNANNATSGTGPSDQTKTYGVNLTLSANTGTLARTGYTFSGWNTAADGSGTTYAESATYTANAPVTLYAKWTANTYTVTFDTQGGTGGSSSVVATYDSTMPAATAPARDGYVFTGYFSATNGGGTAYYTATMVSARNWDLPADTTLYANWSDTLGWDANGVAAGQTDGSGVWSDAGKWWTGVENTTWTPGANASFGNGGAGAAVTLSAPTAVNAFTFNPFTGTYTLGTSGQAITLNNGIIKNAGSGAVTFASPIKLGAAQTWVNDSPSLITVPNGANLTDNAGYQLTIDGAGSFSFGAAGQTATAITGAGDLVKNGSGLLVIGGTNDTFTGNVTVNGGVVRVNKPNSINGNLTLSNGVYEHYWNDAYTRTLGAGPQQIRITSGASGFSLNGNTGMTVTLNNSAAFELVWGDPLFNPSVFVLQADTAQVNSAVTLANKLDLNGTNRTIQVSSGTTGAARAAISGQIRDSTGTAGITKSGAGLLTLSNGANAWNGPTSVQGGILDLAGMTSVNIAGGTGRTITVGAGCGIRFNALSNTYLNRLVETSDEIGVMSGGTANSFDFSSSTGANLPNAFLGNWAGNGAKAEFSGTITPASDAYRLGAKGGNGALGIVGDNKLTGARGLIVGQTGCAGQRIVLAGSNDFTGDTVINTGAKLTLGNNLAIQNSTLDVGAAGGNFALNSAGTITGVTLANNPTFGGLKGSRALLTVFTNAGGNNEANLPAASVTGFTLNPGEGKICDYAGSIANFTNGTTIIKTGLGTQILSGTNTYSGTTTVSAGKLFIDGSLSDVVAALDVSSGATLGGTGTIGRNVTIAGGGKLEFGISSAPGSHNNLEISAGRDFAFSGASELTITSSGGASTGTYTLVTGGNNISGVAPATVNLPAGWSANVSISGNSLLLEVTGIGVSTYAVTYNGNGSTGGGVPVDSNSYTNGATVTVLDNTNGLVKTGYSFAGWNTAANGSGTPYAPAATFSINANTALYAQWTANTYTVTLDAQGGTGGSNSVVATYGSAMPVATAPTRAGYTFGGYYTAVDGGGTQYYTAAMASARTWNLAANTTLYAKWTANTYTVTLDAQGGTGGSNSVVATYGSAMPVATAPTRTGYTFGGYYTAADGGGTQYYTAAMASVRNWDVAANTMLYAKWTVNIYTVSYDANGAISGTAPSSQSKTHDVALTLASNTGNLARIGYTFAGWNTATNGSGTDYAEGASYTENASITLYAKWTANSALMTVYDQTNSAGTGYEITDTYTIYSGTGIPGGLDNQISSFILVQGYMAVVAAQTNGLHPSKTYIASEGPLVVNSLPAELDNTISFIRIVPWRNTLKKGIGEQDDPVVAGVEPDWYYNWGADLVRGQTVTNREFVPMSWGHTGSYPSNITKYLAMDQVSTLLSFNEPDYSTEQSGQWGDLYIVSTAVVYHTELQKAGLRLSSPAVHEENAGGTNDWLTLFLNQTESAGIRTDFVALHWYDWGNNPAVNTNPTPESVLNRLKGYLSNSYHLYRKPIWLTEFNANPARAKPIHDAFIQLAMPYLDSVGYVERYAYFQTPTDSGSFFDVNTNITTTGIIWRDHASVQAYVPRGLPSPWLSTDVGSVAQAGDVIHAAGTYTVCGTGAGITGTNDAFQYMYQPLSGDITISAKINSMIWRQNDTIGGVMIRESLTAGSKHAMMSLTTSNGAKFRNRTTTDGATANAIQAGIAAPYWVKLVRSGDTLTGYHSPDGATWTQSGSQVIAMSNTVYAGFAVSSTTNGVFNDAIFTDVTVTSAPTTYTVSYDGNSSTGGSAPSPQTKTYDVALTLASNTGNLARIGYAFAGWNTAANGLGTDYAEGASYTANASVTLYAKWTANSYTVTFNKQSGAGGSNSVVATYGSAMPAATAPSRTGYTFGGYYTAVDGGGTQYYTAAMANARNWDIAANTTLYAKWTVSSYTVTFDANGGGTPSPTSKSVTYDSTYGTLATVMRTGYTFNGWFTAASGGTEVTSATTVANASDHMLYAQWTLTPVSVITDLNTVNVPEGGTNTFQVKLSNQPTSNVTVTVSNTAGDTDITVQSGGTLTFTTGDWDTYQTVTLAAANDADTANGSATITCDASDAAYTDKNVTANEVDKHTTLTVTNDGNGTTVPSGSVVVEKGLATNISATASGGYNFANWSVTSGSPTMGDTNAAGTTVTISDPATVRANFVLKTYTVSYNGNINTGGTAPADQTKTNGVDLILASNSGSLVKTGYSFNGWNTDANGGGTYYAEGGNYSDDAGVTLYARWIINAPAAPAGLSATANVDRVELTWSASGTASDYNVKRSTVSGSGYATLTNTASTAFSDTTVAQGTTYYYVVSAVNAGGESTNSSEVSATLPFVLPFADDFEAIPVGSLNGKNGWEALNANVQTNIALGTNAVSIDADDGYVKHAFSGNETNVWTDLHIQPVFAPEPMIPSATDCTAVVYFNTNGHPVVYDGTNRLELAGITVTNGNWIRLTVRSDYAAKTWDLYIDGAPATNGLGFYNDLVTRYEYLEVKGGSASDGAELDEISINTLSPFGEPAILTVISGHGAPTPSGAMEYITNTVVNAWIAGSPIIDGGTKYVCTGWIREGSEPGSGTETNLSFTITNDTTITWQWQTNYWINLGTMGE